MRWKAKPCATRRAVRWLADAKSVGASQRQLRVVDVAPLGGRLLRGLRAVGDRGFLKEAGLVAVRSQRVLPAAAEAGKLTVALWLAEDPRIISDDFRKADAEFA